MAGGERAFQAERLRLAADLKRVREAASLSTRELAAIMGVSQTKIVHLETGRRAARPDDVAIWAQHCGVEQEQAADLVDRAARAQTDVANWRQALREAPSGLADIQREVAAMERVAHTFREFQLTLIPGLLQTAEYARRVFLAEEPDRMDIGEAVAARLERQAGLYDADKHFEFVMSEAALRWRVGPAYVQAAQIDRIRQVTTLENVYVGVIPVDIEAPIWRYHPFGMFDTQDDDGPALVIVETLGLNLSVSDPETVERYRTAFRELQQAALTGVALAEVLDRV